MDIQKGQFRREEFLLSVLELPFQHSTEALEEDGIVALEPSDNDLNVARCLPLLCLNLKAQCRLFGIFVVFHGGFALMVLTPPAPTCRPRPYVLFRKTHSGHDGRPPLPLDLKTLHRLIYALCDEIK